MKKTIVNLILYGLMAILSITICVLIIKIINRPRYVSPETSQAAVIQEIAYQTSVDKTLNEASNENTLTDNSTNDTTNDLFSPSTASDNSSTQEVVDTPVNTKHGKTSTKVNIRELADDQSRILETVEEGYTFEIIEILDSGWVKIRYDSSVGYISSKYVILTSQ